MNNHYTTLDIDGTDTPVVVEYAIHDMHDVEVLAVRVDMPGEPGPALDLDKDTVRDMADEIDHALPWDGRASRRRETVGFRVWQ